MARKRLIEVVDVLGAPKAMTGDGIVPVGTDWMPKAPGLVSLGPPAPPEQDPGPPDPNRFRLLDGEGRPLETPLPLKKGAVSFMWDREAPPEWQAWLDKVFPPNDRVSWLKIVWCAGDEVVHATIRDGRVVNESVHTDPVQRWVLFQMSRQVPSAVLPFLMGPPPHPKTNRIPLMREQWDLYRDLKCYAQPYWIIQGERGGHKRRFNKHEQKLLKAQRLPVNPPAAGDLAYAPFDNRVIDKIIAYDHVQFWNRAIELDERKPDDLDAEEKQTTQDMRKWLLTWLESQVEAQMDSLPIGRIATSHDVAPLDVDLERHNLITAD